MSASSTFSGALPAPPNLHQGDSHSGVPANHVSGGNLRPPLPRLQPPLPISASHNDHRHHHHHLPQQHHQVATYPPAGVFPSLNKPVEDRFLVSIDTYTASREAGDKRQKNADASARYRRRKADQAAEEKNRMAQLQEENRYLGGRVIELTRQREFYRAERRALREAMLGVPGLEEIARKRPATPVPPYEE